MIASCARPHVLKCQNHEPDSAVWLLFTASGLQGIYKPDFLTMTGQQEHYQYVRPENSLTSESIVIVQKFRMLCALMAEPLRRQPRTILCILSRVSDTRSTEEIWNPGLGP